MPDLSTTLRRRLGLFAIVGVAGVGVACMGFALHGQHHAVEPRLTTTTSVTGRAVPVSSHPAAVPVMHRSKPTSISIPAIGVHSRLQSLGQNADGTIEVPQPGPRYDDAGWYRYSPTPGSLGPAVIVGHIDSAAHGPSVFFRLGELRTHDAIKVTRADGSVATFTVDAVRRYPKADFPTKLVYGNTDHAALRLVTCGGSFDHATGHYVDNVVVFASLS